MEKFLGIFFIPIAQNPYVVICVFFVFLIVFLACCFRQEGRAGLFTMLGMLGTFIGIVAGLWTFDETKMDTSIPSLLEGMKIAFITSVLGIIFSMLYSLIRYFSREKEDTSSIEGLLEKIARYTEIHAENSKKLLDSNALILKSLGGDSENSLVGQIKLLKNDTNDNHKELSRTLKEFAEGVAKASTESIVEALQDVVKNFNEKITDQFGEHFKELNSAVRELVIWQEQYKNYLESFKDNLTLADEAIANNKHSMNTISAHMLEMKEYSKEIPENFVHLEKIIKMQNTELLKLVGTIGTFSTMRENAAKVLPEIQESLNRLGKELTDSITTTMSGLSENLKNNQSTFTSFMKESLSSSGKEKEVYIRSLADMQQNLGAELARSTKKIESMMAEVFTVSDSHIKEQVKTIIEQMGSELTSISKHLARDYKELSRQLTETIKQISFSKRGA